jgi:tRNA (mo5U34)-methyltransferase
MNDAEAEFAAMSRDELLARARAEEWYHCIDVGDFVTPGHFDLRDVVNDYGFPADMTGMRVLDIGRSSGYFAFEFERRGADVTATELPATHDKDYVGGPIVAQLIRDWTDEQYRQAGADPSVAGKRIDFFLAKALLGSRVKGIEAAIGDLTPESVGQFDLVFAGSVLNHVRDPNLGLQRLYSVTKEGGLLIVANPLADDPSPKPSVRFFGLDTPGLTTWFVPNEAALVMMLRAAGFTSVTVVASALGLPRPGNKPMPHAVVHARRGTLAEARAMFAASLEAKHAGISKL